MSASWEEGQGTKGGSLTKSRISSSNPPARDLSSSASSICLRSSAYHHLEKFSRRNLFFIEVKVGRVNRNIQKLALLLALCLRNWSGKSQRTGPLFCLGYGFFGVIFSASLSSGPCAFTSDIARRCGRLRGTRNSEWKDSEDQLRCSFLVHCNPNSKIKYGRAWLDFSWNEPLWFLEGSAASEREPSKSMWFISFPIPSLSSFASQLVTFHYAERQFISEQSASSHTWYKLCWRWTYFSIRSILRF